MNGRLFLNLLLIGVGLFADWEQASRAVEFSLAIRSGRDGVELSWPTTVTNANQERVFPEYEVQASSDLVHWQPIGGKVRGLDGRSGPQLTLWLGAVPGPAFYRLSADPNSLSLNETANGGAEVFGYNAQFAAQLASLGRLSAGDFATNGAQVSYLPQLSWDPRTAQFWTNFYSPNLLYAEYGGGFNHTNLAYNFRLDDNELAFFLTNGFVVSERLGGPTFGDLYYRIFNGDLPVFITTDSILHAWHRSYQSMLEELEELHLSTLLEQIITNMSLQLPSTWAQFGQGPLRTNILDADYFLTVARSLWASQQVASALGDSGVNQQVADTLAAINNLVLKKFWMFGTSRWVDLSQFKVRGHYDASERLRRYFRTMMWCGRTDLRLATFPPNEEDDIRQLGTGVILHHLLRQSGQFTNWLALEQITRVFVGITDSMTFAQFGDLLSAANIHSPADVPDLVTLTNLQTRLLTGELGAQNIHSDHFWSPLCPVQIKLPRSLTLCGQKFVLDSWALSQVVFDRILWPSDDRDVHCGSTNVAGKVIRRKPSCLDVAYAALGNDQTVPDLVARIADLNGEQFRDGLPYQHNLQAVREVIDGQDSQIWSDNIYTAWLAALRSLSAPTTDPTYPEAMRSRAWAMKTLNTQLASWTELRHDTLLYAKQSYTEPLICGYPDGFVEPRLEFWQRMRILANVTSAALAALPLSGSITITNHDPWYPGPATFDLDTVKSNQVAFLGTFSGHMLTLEGITTKELAQQPLSQAETNFLKNTIERYLNYLGVRQWDGWYPQLFYTNGLGGYAYQSPGCDLWDPLVADVHTDLPDDIVCDPGMVLHEAVGQVDLLLIAVDNGPDRMVYAGPVLSHYEFEVPGVARMSDAEWKTNLQAGQKPPRPDWTRSYLLPGSFPLPPGYP